MLDAVMSPSVNAAVGSVTAAGTPPGATKQEQALLTALLCALHPSMTQHLAFVRLMTGLLQHRLDVLAWVLHPAQKATLWAGAAAGDQLAMHVGGRSQQALNGPRWSPRSSIERHLEQQQARQLEQHTQERAAGVEEGFSPLLHFAAGAVQLCEALLLQPLLRDWVGQLGTNILEDVSAASSEVHLHKVKAMLVVLAGAHRDLLVRSWHVVWCIPPRSGGSQPQATSTCWRCCCSMTGGPGACPTTRFPLRVPTSLVSTLVLLIRGERRRKLRGSRTVVWSSRAAAGVCGRALGLLSVQLTGGCGDCSL